MREFIFILLVVDVSFIALIGIAFYDRYDARRWNQYFDKYYRYLKESQTQNTQAYSARTVRAHEVIVDHYRTVDILLGLRDINDDSYNFNLNASRRRIR